MSKSRHLLLFLAFVLAAAAAELVSHEKEEDYLARLLAPGKKKKTKKKKKNKGKKKKKKSGNKSKSTKSTKSPIVRELGLQPDFCGVDDVKFNICLDFRRQGGFPQTYEPWMDEAIRATKYWENVITHDTVETIENFPYGFPPFVDFSTIDFLDDLFVVVLQLSGGGTGTLLGAGLVKQALLTDEDELFPVEGYLLVTTLIDTLTEIEQELLFRHEIAHVLGFGNSNFWNRGGVRDGDFYTGEAVLKEWRKLGCTGDVPLRTGNSTSGNPLPRDHWQGSCLGNELMAEGTAELVGRATSTLTFAALEDLNYTINYAAADEFGFEDLLECDQCSWLSGKSEKSAKSGKSTKAGRRLLDPTSKPPSQVGGPPISSTLSENWRQKCRNELMVLRHNHLPEVPCSGLSVFCLNDDGHPQSVGCSELILEEPAGIEL